MIQLDSNGYTARIDPSRGGSCVQLSRFGADVLRTPSTVGDYETEPFFYGTPLLFFPNRISNGQFEFEGRTYKIPINEPDTGCFLHGMLHETPFEVIRSQTDGVMLLYRATPQAPYLTFPHAFTLILEWSLSAEGLLQTVTFTNDSDENMPVALAFHTTFRLPFSDAGKADAVSMKLDTSLEFSRNMKNYLPDGGCTSEYPDKQSMEEGTFYPAPRRMSRLFKMGQKKELILTDPCAGVQVKYAALQGYDYWMFYNGIAPDFLCVEPQSWLSNCPNAPFAREETGFDFLVPGEKRVYKTLLNIERV